MNPTKTAPVTHRSPHKHSQNRLLLLFALASLTLVFRCGEKTPPAPDDSAEGASVSRIHGTYLIVPSFRKETLVLGPDNLFFLDKKDNTLPIKGRYEINGLFLRLYLPDTREPGPSAVFPLNGYDPVEWKGIWKGNIRFLKKVSDHSSVR